MAVQPRAAFVHPWKSIRRPVPTTTVRMRIPPSVGLCPFTTIESAQVVAADTSAGRSCRTHLARVWSESLPERPNAHSPGVPGSDRCRARCEDSLHCRSGGAKIVQIEVPDDPSGSPPLLSNAIVLPSGDQEGAPS